MSAKEYLMQIGLLEERIKLKREEVLTLKEKSISMGSLSADHDRVIASPEDKLSKSVINFVEAEKQCKAMIKEWQDLRNKIINEILTMSDKRYVDILYYRYVNLIDDFSIIADKIGYSYSRTIHMHGEALEIFRETYLSIR